MCWSLFIHATKFNEDLLCATHDMASTITYIATVASPESTWQCLETSLVATAQGGPHIE